MSRSDSKVWEDFMQSEFVQSELKKIKKEAQAVDQWSVNMDRNKLYGPGADPKNTTTLSESAETMGVNAGGASMVGSGDSKALYTTKPAPVPGGEEQYADTTVEGLEDIQKAMMDVAMREPTGKPLGTQDNMPEKWDGIQAAGKATKPFTKQSQAYDPNNKGAADAAKAISQSFMGGHKMMEGEEPSLEQILSDLEKEEGEGSKDGSEEGEHMMAPEMMAMGAAKKKETVALLKELVKIANELDSQGQHEDASEIDAVIKSEVETLASSKKKTK